MDRKIEYNFFHWGPFLYRTKLTDKEVNQIKLLCNKNKKRDYRKELAGFLKEEYSINKNKLFEIILPYLKSYYQTYFQYTGKHLGKTIKLKQAWVNFMKKYEANPLHSHSEDLSFVLYIQIPDELIKEDKETITSGTKPGSINFIINFSTKNFINSHAFFPEKGDFYIFPANLSHYVNPFTCNGERISVSGNLKVQ